VAEKNGKKETAAEAKSASGSNPDEPIVIKKYANRRLYNTATGEFVTLETLHQMVQREELFVVQDAKSGKDLTSSVLTQIIAEEETKGHSMLPLNTLRQLLKLYSDGIGPQFSNYLEQSIDAFSQNQQKMMQQMTDMLSGNPGIDQWAEISRRNLELFQNSFSMFNPQGMSGNSTGNSSGNAAGNGSGKGAAQTEEPAENSDQNSELETLRRQMAEMQQQLNSLSKD